MPPAPTKVLIFSEPLSSSTSQDFLLSRFLFLLSVIQSSKIFPHSLYTMGV